MLPYAIVMTVLLAVLLWAVSGERKVVHWIVKPLAALTFIAFGWASGASSSTYGTILFVGLLLAAGGDVLLIPKDRRTFLAGLVSFLLGHVAYGVAFAARELDLTWTAGVALAGGLASIPVLRWLWPHVEASMRAPVIAYVVVITTMVALAAGTVAARGNPWIAIGALGFYLSDLAVARERFVESGFVNRAWGLPLYFFSQLILAGTASTP